MHFVAEIPFTCVIVMTVAGLQAFDHVVFNDRYWQATPGQAYGAYESLLDEDAQQDLQEPDQCAIDASLKRVLECVLNATASSLEKALRMTFPQ